MAYYLGRDVKVIITTEADESINVDSLALITSAAAFDATNTGVVAWALADASNADASTGHVKDLTGVDLGIAATDEDVTYMGQKTTLKTEIKKETTVSLTMKKANANYDIMFNGPTNSTHAYDGVGNHGARWGLNHDGSNHDVSDGKMNPKDHTDSTSTNCTFGYRIFIKLKDATEVIAVPNCTMTGHTVSLNADGTTEETIEFMSNMDLIVGTTVAACETQTTCANI